MEREGGNTWKQKREERCRDEVREVLGKRHFCKQIIDSGAILSQWNIDRVLFVWTIRHIALLLYLSVAVIVSDSRLSAHSAFPSPLQPSLSAIRYHLSLVSIELSVFMQLCSYETPLLIVSLSTLLIFVKNRLYPLRILCVLATSTVPLHRLLVTVRL